MKDSLQRLQTVTLKAASEMLCISVRTLHRLIASGELPQPFKVGASSRLLVDDLERFIERQRRGR